MAKIKKSEEKVEEIVEEKAEESVEENIKRPYKPKWQDIVLVFLLIIGAYLRLSGVNWDENQHLHPDERFLTMVESGLVPVESFSAYWDTAVSTLNPNNQGFGFFVYGTFPIFLVRYAAEWMGQIGYGEVFLVGRQLSALADLGVILLVYIIGAYAYNRNIGMVSAAFSTFAVLQIQLSHFFAVDTFLNLFILFSILMAVIIAKRDDVKPSINLTLFALFGLGLGLAMASKVSAFPVPILVVIAVGVRFSRMSLEERNKNFLIYFGYLVVGAFVSILVFRIFQPYAFAGPGFFGFSLNQAWVDNMISTQAAAAGNVDFPPAMQWAGRSFLFAFQNILLWGMGLPMGIAAWAGVIWVAVLMLKGQWRPHIIIWVWTFGYFTYQSMGFNPTMRYQLPVYPTLAIFAGWFVVTLWDYVSSKANFETVSEKLSGFIKPVGRIIAISAVVLTIIWAFAFFQIYNRPVTRVAASDWIFQNIPGPINLLINTGDGKIFNQPIPFPYNLAIQAEQPYSGQVSAKASGTMSQVHINNISLPNQSTEFLAAIIDTQDPGQPLVFGNMQAVFEAKDFDAAQRAVFNVGDAINLDPERDYILRIEPRVGAIEVLLQDVEIFGLVQNSSEEVHIELEGGLISDGNIIERVFRVPANVALREIRTSVRLTDFSLPSSQNIKLELSDVPDFSNILAESRIPVDLSTGVSEGQIFGLNKSVNMVLDQTYYYRFTVESAGGAISLSGSAIGTEAPWDDPLPLRISGYDGYGGIYQQNLTFDFYWDDSPAKLERFLEILDDVDYIAISSSRQWASTTRIPQRFPLVIQYYDHLMGCPGGQSIEDCYNAAQVGTFEGELGFDLIQVFESRPNIGSFTINDQYSEEAFTVYDHPKVFIFKKNADYDHQKVTDILSAVDLSAVIRVTPKEAGNANLSGLLLPEDTFDAQQLEGTWSELFNIDGIVNRWQPLTVVIWYLAVMILGLGTYPLIRMALPGLQDRGYPLARGFGMLLLAYLSWIAGSIGLGFTRSWITVFYVLIIAGGVWIVSRNRETLINEWREKRKYFLSVEALFLGFFLLTLLIRLGNPDLWHPFKGGEKPMDFSYFNAVLKSKSFPPYDPWFAGGYINYYYYGFVYVGTLVKMLGIVPAVAYNLIIPTLFGLLSIGAFSVGWNLYIYVQDKKSTDEEVDEENPENTKILSPWLVGLSAAAATSLIGNLGTLRMIIQGLQRIGSQGAYTEEAFFLTKIGWLIPGIFQYLSGEQLPYSIANWYWDPSRIVPGQNVITEFPWFTTIYGDLHAHLIALPITVLVIAWALSIMSAKTWSQNFNIWKAAWTLVLGALAVGALRPTNTWDYPTYLVLAVVAVFYGVWRYYQPQQTFLKEQLPEIVIKIMVGIGAAGIVAGLSLVLYQPFSKWYIQGFTDLYRWEGPYTPSGDYFAHWGLFLFVLLTWIVWETRQWMISTPLSSLRKLLPYKSVIIGTGIALVGTILVLFALGVSTQWLVLPMALWAAILLLRPKMAENKRAVLFLVGTALFLTIMVEIVALRGDSGRMNMVFKFYLQAWVLFAISSAAALGWVLNEVRLWRASWSAVWSVALTAIFVSTVLYPATATISKIVDRYSNEAPITLDGMAYMEYVTYDDAGQTLDLAEDYNAIQWLQQNVVGSPVIVEAYTIEYRWGSRNSIYTGLPSIIGWRNHQSQQRVAGTPGEIDERINDVQEFYNTTDVSVASDFLETYSVGYIILGQLEQAYYNAEGLTKFAQFEGELWQEVYQQGDTAIYKVIRGQPELD